MAVSTQPRLFAVLRRQRHERRHSHEAVIRVQRLHVSLYLDLQKFFKKQSDKGCAYTRSHVGGKHPEGTRLRD
jgi:hypothetical protein